MYNFFVSYKSNGVRAGDGGSGGDGAANIKFFSNYGFNAMRVRCCFFLAGRKIK